jgi:hypothetical protein
MGGQDGCEHENLYLGEESLREGACRRRSARWGRRAGHEGRRRALMAPPPPAALQGGRPQFCVRACVPRRIVR